MLKNHSSARMITLGTPRRFRASATALGIFAAVSVLVPQVSVAATNEPDPGVVGLTDSSALPGDAVVSGQVLDTFGQSVSDGTLVELVAWPAAEALDALEVGETVKTASVGYALTDAEGNFELRYSDPDSLQYFADDRGVVSFEVIAAGEDGVASFNLPLDVTDATDTVVADENLDEAVEFVAESAVSDVQLQAVEASDEEIDQASSLNKNCTTKVSQDYGNQWVSVGRAGYADGVKVTFTYKSGSSSELGIATKKSTGSASWSASGTTSVSSSAKQDFPQVVPTSRGGAVWKTQFRYKKFQKDCVIAFVGTTQTIEIRPTGYAGGQSRASFTPPTTAPANNCVSHLKGGGFTLDTTKASSFSAGVSVGGVSLSSQTGYSKSTSIRYEFTKAKTLCGTNGPPASGAGYVFVK